MLIVDCVSCPASPVDMCAEQFIDMGVHAGYLIPSSEVRGGAELTVFRYARFGSLIGKSIHE